MKKYSRLFTYLMLAISLLLSASERPPCPSLAELCLITMNQHAEVIRPNLNRIPNDLLESVADTCPDLQHGALKERCYKSTINPAVANLIADTFPQFIYDQIDDTHTFDSAYHHLFSPKLLAHGNEELIKNALARYLPYQLLHAYHPSKKQILPLDTMSFSIQTDYYAVYHNDRDEIVMVKHDEDDDAITIPIHLDENYYNFFGRIGPDGKTIALCSTLGNVLILHKDYGIPYIQFSYPINELYSFGFSSDSNLFIVKQPEGNTFIWPIPHEYLTRQLSLQAMVLILLQKINCNYRGTQLEQLTRLQKRLPIVKTITHNLHMYPASCQPFITIEIEEYLNSIKDKQETLLLYPHVIKKRCGSGTMTPLIKVREQIPIVVTPLPVTCRALLIKHANQMLLDANISGTISSLEQYIDILQNHDTEENQIKKQLVSLLNSALDSYMQNSAMYTADGD